MHLFNDEIIQALCWTLIHSLWQGLLLAIIGGTVILATKSAKPVIRYNLLSVLFFLFVLVACFTFVRQWQLVSSNNIAAFPAQKNTETFLAGNSYPSPDVVTQKTNLDVFVSYFDEHASLIVTIWFIILSAQFIKLIANAAYVQRIKHYKTHQAPKYWKRRMEELAKKMQIKQRVSLLQSEIVRVPVMVGFIKPIILFPFSIIMQLPPEQVEAVLLHELAHIKRKDYFINLLQNFAEIIFFFNPAVLWISSLIRDERENCCDDIAINQSKNKKEFIDALVCFQEYNLEKSIYTLAFPGRKNHLLERVKRMLTNNNKTLNNMEKISLATGIVIIGFVALAFRQIPQKQEIKSAPATITAQKKVVLTDSIPSKDTSISKFSYVTTIDGNQYRALVVNDKVTKLYVNGKKIPDGKLGGYKDITERIFIQVKKDRDKLADENIQLAQQREKLLAEQDRKQDEMAKVNKETLDQWNKQRDELSAKIQALDAQKQLIHLEELKKANADELELLKNHNAELMALEEELRNQQEIMVKTLGEKDSKKQAEMLNKQIIELRDEQMKIEKERRNINEMISNEDRNSLLIPGIPSLRPDNPDVPGAPLESISTSPIPPVPSLEENQTLKLIINQLIDEKIINSTNNLSIILNAEMFKVNDIIQPGEIQAEFKERYLKAPKDHVIYSRRGSSVHADIKVESGSSHVELNENK